MKSFCYTSWSCEIRILMAWPLRDLQNRLSDTHAEAEKIIACDCSRFTRHSVINYHYNSGVSVCRKERAWCQSAKATQRTLTQFHSSYETTILITQQNFSKLDSVERQAHNGEHPRVSMDAPPNKWKKKEINSSIDYARRVIIHFYDDICCCPLALSLSKYDFICIPVVHFWMANGDDLWEKSIFISYYVPSKTKTQCTRPARRHRCSREHSLAWILDQFYFRRSPSCSRSKNDFVFTKLQRNASPINLIVSITPDKMRCVVCYAGMWKKEK